MRCLLLLLLPACGPRASDDTARDTGPTGGDGFGAVTATAGACEGDATGRAPAPAPAVWAEASGSTVRLHLDDLTANCCPTPGASVTRAGSTFDVVFDDLAGGGGCWCECVTDFVVAIEDVAPGDWTLEVEYRGAALGTATVTVS